MLFRKKIQLFETTNIALESLRVMLEVSLKKQIQFRKIDINLFRETHTDRSRKCPLSRDYHIDASFTTKDSQHGEDGAVVIHAEIELTNHYGHHKPIWLLKRAHLKIGEDWFWAHPEGYKAVEPGINLPPRIRIAMEKQGPGEAIWNIGSGHDDVITKPVLG